MRWVERLGFLFASAFAFYIGWIFASLVFFLCATLRYYRVCGMMRNIWCGVLPYKAWTDNKPQEYTSYISHLKLRLKAFLRWLMYKETLADVSLQDSFQVNFSEFFSNKQKQGNNICGESNTEYQNNLYGEWKEGTGEEWKVSK